MPILTSSAHQSQVLVRSLLFDPRHCRRIPVKHMCGREHDKYLMVLSVVCLRVTLKLERCSFFWREDGTRTSDCARTKKRLRVSYLSHERGSWFFLCCPSDASLRTCLCLWLTLCPYLLASTLHSSPLPSGSSFLDSQSFCPLVFFPLTSLCRLSSLSHLLPAFFFTLCFPFLSSPRLFAGKFFEEQPAS